MFSPYQAGQGSIARSITVVLVLANVAVFIVLSVGGDVALITLAQTGDLFYSGFYWQPFTAIFVHFGIPHILFNMLALLYFGRLNELNFSTPQYLAIYFGSGLLGNVASLFLIPPMVPTGGASGAIFGLLGSYVSIERRGSTLALGLLYAFFIFVASAGPGVNVFAHLFGLAAGFVMGFAFSNARPGGSR